jgi:rhamnose transport system permease protein
VKARWQLILQWETFLVFLLIATFIIGASLSSAFLTGNNLSLASADLMEKAIMALGLTLVIVAGEIDLSVASVLGLSSAILGELVKAGLPILIAIPLVLIVGALCGLFNGLLVARVGLPSLVVTLGTLALFRGLAYVVLGDQAVSKFPKTFTDFGFNNVPGTRVPWTVVVFAVLAVLAYFVLHRSILGRRIFAIGNNAEAARFSGVDVARIRVQLFVASGTLAALAGIVFTARFASARPDNGYGFELDVITAVLLGGVSIFGGRGRLIGVVLALFLIGALRNALSLADLGAEKQSIVIGVLLIVSVIGTNALAGVQERLARRHALPTVPAAGSPPQPEGGGS